MNCFQILYIRSLNTMNRKSGQEQRMLWIAFRFCIFVLWTQFTVPSKKATRVVNCFQILYIRSLNTIIYIPVHQIRPLWIAFRFCIFVLWTQLIVTLAEVFSGCELLSDFVYSFFEHNEFRYWRAGAELWIAFRFCIFVLWTQYRGE